jgi:hypothetical protein
LKQSGRTWWIEQGNGLDALGFKHTESDWGLYYRTGSKERGSALDIVVAARSSEEIDEVMKGLSQRWRITELGEIFTTLGIKVSRDRPARKVWLTKPLYIDRIVERFPGHRPRVKPLRLHQGDHGVLASLLARQVARPTEHLWQMALGVLAYLSSTRTIGLTFGG